MFFGQILYLFALSILFIYTRVMFRMNVEKRAPVPAGARIFAANHPSTTDPFLVAGMVRRRSYILIIGHLFQVPVIGMILRKMGHIPVVTGSGQVAFDRALKLLQQGKTVIIFPEGALSPSEGGFQQARTGVARLALASGAPVIPVGIHLADKRFQHIPFNWKGKRVLGKWYLRGPYFMTTGEPLTYHGDENDRMLVRNVANKIMRNIIDLAQQSRLRMNCN